MLRYRSRMCNILFSHIWILFSVLKWGASSRWSSSLYFPMRNSDEMTTGKTHPTLQIENFSKIEKSQSRWVGHLTKPGYKVRCVFPMAVVSILIHPEFRPNYHREDATHFILIFGVSLEFAENRVLDQAIFSGSGFWRKWKSSNYSINRWFTFWKSSRNKK